MFLLVCQFEEYMNGLPWYLDKIKTDFILFISQSDLINKSEVKS